ncbi:hypothetical protein FRB90_000694 [Tulasnella sp. 427]|nr:hypothetical protein FRB90_000694 [Tulasnella sp. 427]
MSCLDDRFCSVDIVSAGGTRRASLTLARLYSLTGRGSRSALAILVLHFLIEENASRGSPGDDFSTLFRWVALYIVVYASSTIFSAWTKSSTEHLQRQLRRQSAELLDFEAAMKAEVEKNLRLKQLLDAPQSSVQQLTDIIRQRDEQAALQALIKMPRDQEQEVESRRKAKEIYTRANDLPEPHRRAGVPVRSGKSKEPRRNWLAVSPSPSSALPLPGPRFSPLLNLRHQPERHPGCCTALSIAYPGLARVQVSIESVPAGRVAVVDVSDAADSDLDYD